MLSIELGTEILKQGTNLKLSGAERITDNFNLVPCFRISVPSSILNIMQSFA